MDLDKRFNSIEKAIAEIKDMLAQLFIVQEVHKQNQMPNLLSVKEVCEMLKISEMTLYTKRSNGEIKAIKKGNRVYFTKEEFMRYLHDTEGKFKSK
jgi:excisionase family DNA binding protein